MCDWPDWGSPWRNYSEDILDVVLPDGLTYIGESAIYCCTGIICHDLSVWTGKAAFYEYYGLESVDLGSAEITGSNAFAHSGLVPVTVPDSLHASRSMRFTSV